VSLCPTSNIDTCHVKFHDRYANFPPLEKRLCQKNKLCDWECCNVGVPQQKCQNAWQLDTYCWVIFGLWLRKDTENAPLRTFIRIWGCASLQRREPRLPHWRQMRKPVKRGRVIARYILDNIIGKLIVLLCGCRLLIYWLIFFQNKPGANFAPFHEISHLTSMRQPWVAVLQEGARSNPRKRPQRVVFWILSKP
jgi:hypothetical protein